MHATQNSLIEWSYSSGIPYDDPFNDVEMDVVFEAPGADERRPPVVQDWVIVLEAVGP